MNVKSVKGETIVISTKTGSVTVALKDATELITALLAARKDGYGQVRSAKVTERTAAKKAAAEKKEVRLAEQSKKLAEKKAKLEAELAKLSA